MYTFPSVYIENTFPSVYIEKQRHSFQKHWLDKFKWLDSDLLKDIYITFQLQENKRILSQLSNL